MTVSRTVDVIISKIQMFLFRFWDFVEIVSVVEGCGGIFFIFFVVDMRMIDGLLTHFLTF